MIFTFDLYLKQIFIEKLPFDGYFLDPQNVHMWIWRLGKRSELEMKYSQVFNLLSNAWGIKCNQRGNKWDKEEAQELTIKTC